MIPGTWHESVLIHLILSKLQLSGWCIKGKSKKKNANPVNLVLAKLCHPVANDESEDNNDNDVHQREDDVDIY